MKKLVRVSLSVLVAVALFSFVGCKNDSEPEPAPANFEGEWKSTDGTRTVSVKDGKFSTEMDALKLEGTYTVDGNTATASMKIPGGSDDSVSFTMKMVDGNDVMALTVPAELTGDKPFDMTFVKKSSTKSDLTGTWTGKVELDGKGTLGDATIVFADNKATLTLAGQTVASTAVTQDGNFFTVTWAEENNALKIGKSTGLVSASGKAWLDGGFVFTKN